jgi:hypothetical protein
MPGHSKIFMLCYHVVALLTVWQYYDLFLPSKFITASVRSFSGSCTGWKQLTEQHVDGTAVINCLTMVMMIHSWECDIVTVATASTI